MKFIPGLYSPAYPAAWLLFGMLFALAVAHFMAIPWPQLASVAFYAVALVWVSVLAWRERRNFWPVTALDVLFVGFVLLVSASLVFQGGFWGESGKFARYLPFMVGIPYLCGRLMREGDIEHFSRIVLYAGLAVLPLLLLDRAVSPDQGGERWAFFGQGHGALLVGALLAAALIALCVRGAASRNPDGSPRSRLFHYGLIGLVTGFLVWVSARGWLMAAIAGLAVLVLSEYRHRGLRGTYLRYLVYVIAVVLLSLVVLPRASNQFYAKLLTMPPQLVAPTRVAVPTHMAGRVWVAGAAQEATHAHAADPILGASSCRPFKEGDNSVTIRWVLYREAVAMFVQSPILGVGAARFGERSCAGIQGYPHSTILQGFSELGLIGGGLFLGLLSLAALTLARRFIVAKNVMHSNPTTGPFALALFAAFLLADQIYGNYFMATGMCLMLGVAASMSAQQRKQRNA